MKTIDFNKSAHIFLHLVSRCASFWCTALCKLRKNCQILTNATILILRYWRKQTCSWILIGWFNVIVRQFSRLENQYNFSYLNVPTKPNKVTWPSTLNFKATHRHFMFNQLLITHNTVFALTDLESKSLKIEKRWWLFEKYTSSLCPKYWNKFLNIAYSLTSFWLRLRRLCLIKSFFQMEQLCIQVLDLFSQILHIVWRRPWKTSMTWL